MMARRRDGTDSLAIVMGALIGLDGVLWLAARCSAWLAGRRLPAGRLLAPLVARAHFCDPSRAWGVRVAGPVLYWTVAALFLILTGLTLVWLRRFGRPTPCGERIRSKPRAWLIGDRFGGPLGPGPCWFAPTPSARP